MYQVPLQKNSHDHAILAGTSRHNDASQAAPPTPDIPDFGTALAEAENSDATQTLAPQQVTTADENPTSEKLHHLDQKPGAAPSSSDEDDSAHEELTPEQEEERAAVASFGVGFMGLEVDDPQPPEPSEREIALAEPPPGKSNAPLSEEEKDRVVVLISYGHSLRQAAAQIGRTHSTLSRNMKKDQDFANKIERFRRYAESDAIREIVTASRKSWRAAAWLLDYLERRERSRGDSLMQKSGKEKSE